MPRYPFQCYDCGETTEVLCTMKERDTLKEPQHCGKPMSWVPVTAAVKFGRTPGKWTGVYDLDYGKRATEDLTVPGKMAALKRAGRIPPDPFDDIKRKAPDAETIKAFS